jgi:hypothetical protein
MADAIRDLLRAGNPTSKLERPYVYEVISSFLFNRPLPVFALPAYAQVKHTEHTMKLAPGQQAPPATINDIAWFAGFWTGEGMGGQNEEHWGPPNNGVMLGTFRHLKDGKPVFYEFMTFVEVEGSLMLRIKHFNPDMTGWEEKDKTVDFKFVAKKDGAVYFSGLTFMPTGKNSATIYLAMRNKDGAVREEVFNFKRANPTAKPVATGGK